MTEPTIQVSAEQVLSIAADELLHARVELRLTRNMLAQAQARIAELEKDKPPLEVVK